MRMLSCDVPGCGRLVGDNKTDRHISQRVGWVYTESDRAFCPDHNPPAETQTPESNVGIEETPVNKRAQILQTAEELINGDRAQTYGPPQNSFLAIAEVLNALGFRHHVPIENKGPEGQSLTKSETLTPTDVALIMIALKLSRTNGARQHEDNWVDLAGYAGLGAELALPPETVYTGDVLIYIPSEEEGYHTCGECGCKVDTESLGPHVSIRHNEKYHGHYRVATKYTMDLYTWDANRHRYMCKACGAGFFDYELQDHRLDHPRKGD